MTPTPPPTHDLREAVARALFFHDMMGLDPWGAHGSKVCEKYRARAAFLCEPGGPIVSELARLTEERDEARMNGVLGWLKTYGKDTLADFTARLEAAEARALAAEAELATLKAAPKPC